MTVLENRPWLLLAMSGTYCLRRTFTFMSTEPTTPEPAEPGKPPVEDPQPYRDPVQPPPGDPGEDRPLRDPIPPDGDQPRM